MTFLPIVERELRIASRLTVTYRNRTLVTAGVSLVAIFMLMFSGVASVRTSIGQATFHILSTLAVLFCLVEGTRKTADCLSEEKREGTMGLLFLTDLKGYDIVLGKLVARSLSSFYGLLAILPVLGFPVLAGGVMPEEFWRMALALTNILFFSLCTGIWVSSWSRSEREANGRAALLMMIFGVGSLSYLATLHPAFAWNPVTAFRTSFADSYKLDPDAYWRSLWVGQGLSWLFLVWSSVAVPRTWQEKVVRVPMMRRWRLGGRAWWARERARMLEINPVYWLASRNAGPRFYLWVFVGVFGFLCAVATVASAATLIGGLLGLSLVFNFILKMRIATQSANAMAEARHNNGLEMMLATPLTVEEIIRGHLLALKRTYLIPVIVVLAAELVGLAGSIVAMWGRSSSGSTSHLGVGLLMLTVGGAGYVSVFVLDVLAVTWAGMWYGLTAKKQSQAAGKTILMVLVAPMAVLPFTALLSCYAVGLYLGCPIFWIVWASGKLRREFRTLAGQQFDAGRGESGWIPGIGAFKSSIKRVPPVIRGEKGGARKELK